MDHADRIAKVIHTITDECKKGKCGGITDFHSGCRYRTFVEDYHNIVQVKSESEEEDNNNDNKIRTKTTRHVRLYQNALKNI